MRARSFMCRLVVSVVLFSWSFIAPQFGVTVANATYTPTDPYGIMVQSDNPYGWWRFGASSRPEPDVGQATSTLDFTATSTTFGATALAPNSDGKAWVVSGSTGSGFSPSGNFVLSGTTARTFEFWIKTASNTTTRALVDTYNGARDAFWILIDGATHKLNVSFRDSRDVVYSPVPAASSVAILDNNVAHHVVVTYDGAGVFRSYVDGTLEVTSSNNAPTLNVMANAWQFLTGPYSGTADEFAFYTTALSSTRISAHYFGPGGQDVTISGHVCVQANSVQTSCDILGPGLPLVGSMVSVKDGSGTLIASPITNSTGHYTTTAHLIFGDTVTVSPATFGPNPPGFVDTFLGWNPGTYVINVSPTGPLPDYPNLDWQYVVPESTNADWWNINGTQMPWFTAGFTATSSQLTKLGLAKQIPTVAPKIALGAIAIVPAAVIGAAGLFLMNVTVLDPAEYTDPVTIVYSTSSQSPSTATGSQSVTLSPGQQTTITVGPGGLTSTSGAAIITNTQPAPGTTVTTTVDSPEIGPAPITVSDPTTIASGQTETNTINCGVLDLQGCLEAVFEPTTTPADLLTSLQAKLYTKVGFADVGYIQTWLANWNPTFSCWTFTVPVTYFTSTGVVSRTDNSTTTLCADNPIVTWVRQFITVGLILFMLVSVIAVVKALIGFRSGVDPQMDGES